MKSVINFLLSVVTVILYMYLVISLLIMNLWQLITFQPLYSMNDVMSTFIKDLENTLRKDD